MGNDRISHQITLLVTYYLILSSYKPKEEPVVLSPGHQYPPDPIHLAVNPMECSFCGISVVRMLLQCCFYSYPHCVLRDMAPVGRLALYSPMLARAGVPFQAAWDQTPQHDQFPTSNYSRLPIYMAQHGTWNPNYPIWSMDKAPGL